MANAGQIRALVSKYEGAAKYADVIGQIRGLLTGLSDDDPIPKEIGDELSAAIRELKRLTTTPDPGAESLNRIRVAAGGAPRPVPEPALTTATATPAPPEPTEEEPEVKTVSVGDTLEIRLAKDAVVKEARALTATVQSDVTMGGDNITDYLRQVVALVKKMATNTYSNDEEVIAQRRKELETLGQMLARYQTKKELHTQIGRLCEIVEDRATPGGKHIRDQATRLREGITDVMHKNYGNEATVLEGYRTTANEIKEALRTHVAKVGVYEEMTACADEIDPQITKHGSYLKTSLAQLRRDAEDLINTAYSDEDAAMANCRHAMERCRADLAVYKTKLAVHDASIACVEEIRPQITRPSTYMTRSLDQLASNAQIVLDQRSDDEEGQMALLRESIATLQANLVHYLAKIPLVADFTRMQAEVANVPTWGGDFIREYATRHEGTMSNLLDTLYGDEAAQNETCRSWNTRLRGYLDDWPLRPPLYERLNGIKGGITDLTDRSNPRVFAKLAEIEPDILRFFSANFQDNTATAATMTDWLSRLETLIAEERRGLATISSAGAMSATALEEQSTDENVTLLNDLRGFRDADNRLNDEQRRIQRDVYTAMSKSGTHGLEPGFEEAEAPVRERVRERVRREILADEDTKATIRNWNTYGEGMGETERRTAMSAVTDWSAWETDDALDADVKADLRAKLDVANRILAAQCAERGIDPPPEIIFKAPTPPSEVGGARDVTSKGLFSPSSGKIELNPDPRGAFADFADLVDTVIHENTHNYQHRLVAELKAGTLDASDPRYTQARAFEANFASGGYVEPEEDHAVYKLQPVERHAWQAGSEAKVLGEELLAEVR